MGLLYFHRPLLSSLLCLTLTASCQASERLEGRYAQYMSPAQAGHGPWETVKFGLWSYEGAATLPRCDVSAAAGCRYYLDGREVRHWEVPDGVRVGVMLDASGRAAEVRARTR